MRRRVGLALEIGVTLLIIAGIWVYTDRSSSPYVPALSEVLKTFRETWLFERFGSDLVPSLIRVALGYALGITIGVGAGLLLGHIRWLRLAAEPTVSFLRSIPPPALLPLFILVFGIQDSMKIAIIAFVCIWPVLLNTIDGVVSLDPTLKATAAIYGINGPARLTRVVLPAISPRIFAGMRTSLSVALLIVVVSEMVASTNGLGYLVLEAQATFAIRRMWAGILMLGIIGYLANTLFITLERRALRWHLRPDQEKA